jgi:predicted phage baseplate assembly protein
MPIPLPNLDDRRWADLVEDGRAQITRYAPQWTDHNIHDPGITLIDLFAWLGEMTDYRLNRVPSRHKRKFLELLGFDVGGPTPAGVMLSFAPASATAPFVLPAGSEFEGTNPDRLLVAYRTLRDTTVFASSLKAVQLDVGTLVDRTHDFTDGFPIQILSAKPESGAAFYLGFDALTPALPFSLGFRFAGSGNDAAMKARILAEAAAQALSCQPVQTRIQCVPAAPAAPVTLPPHHSAVLVWEAFTTSGWVAIPANDDTRSLTLDGIVDITVPAAIAATALGSVATPLFYVRCRVVSGAFDAIPVLLDIEVNASPAEQAVPVTTKFTIKAGVVPTGVAPSPGDSVQLTLSMDGQHVIQSLAFTSGAGPMLRVWTYTAPGASAGEITLDVEEAGIGAGLPDQQVLLRTAPLDVASVELYTLAGSVWQQWTIRDDFYASTRTDVHCVVDAVTGVVTFGSGARGQTPPGESVIFVRYRATVADAGNLAAGVVNRDRKSPVNDVLLKALPAATRTQLKTITRNRAGAINGATAETLNHALGRAVEILYAHERLLELATRKRTTTLDQVDGETVRGLVAPSRGVNLLDLERIALSVPGTRVDRARAWASLHPAYPCLDAPGVVTVVIVPGYSTGRPAPSAGLIDRVWRYLNLRRLVCTTLVVTGPQYVEVTVTATVQSRTGASAAKVTQRIQAGLRAFLDPLAGGPDSLGWPFGRSVYRSEILQLIQNVPGVDHVVTLSMQSDAGSGQCSDIALCRTTLTRSGAHQIEVL